MQSYHFTTVFSKSDVIPTSIIRVLFRFEVITAVLNVKPYGFMLRTAVMTSNLKRIRFMDVGMTSDLLTTA